jgi:putative lysine transport system permease protein
MTTLYVGLECNYAPFNWTESSANDYTLPIANHAGSYADGYDIQIAKLLAEKTGKKVEIVQTVWESLGPRSSIREHQLHHRRHDRHRRAREID